MWALDAPEAPVMALEREGWGFLVPLELNHGRSRPWRQKPPARVPPLWGTLHSSTASLAQTVRPECSPAKEDRVDQDLCTSARGSLRPSEKRGFSYHLPPGFCLLS